MTVSFFFVSGQPVEGKENIQNGRPVWYTKKLLSPIAGTKGELGLEGGHGREGARRGRLGRPHVFYGQT